MKYIPLLILLVTTAVFTLTSCKNEVGPTEPEAWATENVSNAAGQAILKLGDKEIQIRVEDSLHQPIAGILVQGYSTSTKVLIIASDTTGQYYQSTEVVQQSLLKRSRLAVSPIVVTLVRVGAVAFTAYKSYDAISEFFDELQVIRGSDGSIEKVCYPLEASMLVPTILEKMKRYLGSGVTVKIAAQAAAKLKKDPVTASLASYLIKDGRDELISATLAQLFDILDRDLMRVCLRFIHPQGSSSAIVIPIIVIEDIEFNRDFDFKFTFIWGDAPKDLDAHIWTIDNHHIYYSNKGSLDYPPYVALDVDDVTQFGPENITVKEVPGNPDSPSEGVTASYKMAVFNYSGESSIGTSQARVKVFNREGLIDEIVAPAMNTGEMWWNVCRIDYETYYDIAGISRYKYKGFTRVNRYQSDPP